MKPNPFASLNHFTVPRATCNSLQTGQVALDSCRLNAAAPPGRGDRSLDRGVRPETTTARDVPGGNDRNRPNHHRPKTRGSIGRTGPEGKREFTPKIGPRRAPRRGPPSGVKYAAEAGFTRDVRRDPSTQYR